jgi:hypothetical protein
MVDFDAAATATIVSSLISGVAAYLSNKKQMEKNQEFRREMRKEDWYNEIIHSASELRRFTLSPDRNSELVIENKCIDYENSSKKVEEMKSIVNDIVEKRNKKPSHVNIENIEKEIDTLLSYFESPETGPDSISSYNDLTQIVYDRAYNIENMASKKKNEL